MRADATNPRSVISIFETTFGEAHGALIVPVGERSSVSPKPAARCVRHPAPCMEYRSPTCRLRGQPAEQGYIVSPPEEHDWFCNILWQAEIFIRFSTTPAFERLHISSRAEGNVVVGGQKVRPNQSPSCREDIDLFCPVATDQIFICRIPVELPRREEFQRIVAWLGIVCRKNAAPRPSGIGHVIRPGINSVSIARSIMRVCHEHDFAAVTRAKMARMVLFPGSALNDNDQV